MFHLGALLIFFVLSCYLLRKFYFPSSVPSNLNGYNVLITGGSSGIGLSLAELFCHAGANVTLVARDQKKLKSAKESLCSLKEISGQVHTLSVDLCSEFHVLKQILEEHISYSGPVDILVHCAGYAVSRTFLDTPPDTIESLMRTNYLSAVNVTKILLPHMLSDPSRSSQDRRIAFLCSMAGQVGVYGFAAYSASKYALRGFAEVLRIELEHSGPPVTLAFPPDTDTPGLATENVGKPEITLEISSAGGLAKPEDVARVIFRDILDGSFNSSFGLEGKALSWGTAGLLPPVTIRNVSQANLFTFFLNSLAEILAAGPLRAVGIGYALWMRRTISRHRERTLRSRS